MRDPPGQAPSGGGILRDMPGPLPAIAVLAAFFGLAAMDAMIKGLTEAFHVAHIVAFRYAFGALAALPFYLAARGPRLTPEIVRQSSLRAVLIVVTAASFFYALSIIPLGEATALAFTAPLFVVVFARILLGEPIPGIAVVSILLGLGGVAVMVWRDLAVLDFGSNAILGAGLVLLAAVGSSLVMVLTRLHSLQAEASVIVFSQTVAAALLTLPLLVFTWRSMDAFDLLMFLVVGTLGSVSHIALAWGFSRANAARLSPLEYSVLPWAILFGFLFFAEVPAQETLIGAVLIVGACLLMLGRQKAGASGRSGD